jgi:hypothetical protein
MTQNCMLATNPMPSPTPGNGALHPLVPAPARPLLLRMFSDPRALEPAEQRELVAQLTEMVGQHPQQPELRLLLGMACCAASDPQTALDQLQAAVDLAPDYFIARLKLGELCMRLRMMERAEQETHEASLLAAHPLQSEMARRQAQQIREMCRSGLLRPSFPWRFWRRPKAAWQTATALTAPARIVKEAR